MSKGRRVRVLHLIKGLKRGGAETLLAQALRVRDRDRFEYGCAYFLRGYDEVVPEINAGGTEVKLLAARGSSGVLLSVPRIVQYLRRWRPDVVHCHLPIVGVAGRLAGRIAGVPVLYSEHAQMERYRPTTRRLNVLTYGMQARVIAVSEAVAASIRRQVGDRVPIEVIRNGIDLERFSPMPGRRFEVRAELGIPGEAPVVGTVAGFRPQKGWETWLRAASLILEKEPRCRFLVVGDGELSDFADRRIAELGIGGAIHRVGVQEDVRPYLAAMDVYLSASVYEGLGISAVEASAMELPVVATAVGGLPEVVDAGNTGLLVPPESPEPMAVAVVQLLRDAETRRRMGEAGRDRAKMHFDIRKVNRRLEGLYEEVASKSTSAPRRAAAVFRAG